MKFQNCERCTASWRRH